MTDFNIERDFGRLEGKVDGILERLDRRDRDDRYTDRRIRAVERKLYTYGGGLAVLVFIMERVDFTKLLSIVAVASP